MARQFCVTVSTDCGGLLANRNDHLAMTSNNTLCARTSCLSAQTDGDDREDYQYLYDKPVVKEIQILSAKRPRNAKITEAAPSECKILTRPKHGIKHYNTTAAERTRSSDVSGKNELRQFDKTDTELRLLYQSIRYVKPMIDIIYGNVRVSRKRGIKKRQRAMLFIPVQVSLPYYYLPITQMESQDIDGKRSTCGSADHEQPTLRILPAVHIELPKNHRKIGCRQTHQAKVTVTRTYMGMGGSLRHMQWPYRGVYHEIRSRDCARLADRVSSTYIYPLSEYNQPTSARRSTIPQSVAELNYRHGMSAADQYRQFRRENTYTTIHTVASKTSANTLVEEESAIQPDVVVHGRFGVPIVVMKRHESLSNTNEAHPRLSKNLGKKQVQESKTESVTYAEVKKIKNPIDKLYTIHNEEMRHSQKSSMMTSFIPAVPPKQWQQEQTTNEISIQ